jgi:hypothetical protein
MDPWLEGPNLWPDVHATLLPIIRSELVRVLPTRYAALIGQSVWLEGADEDDRPLFGVPDLHVSSPADPATTTVTPGGAAAPVVTTLPAVRRTGHRYLRITDRDRRRLVTVLELLSPSNKDSGKNRPQYLEKRNEYLATGVNLVEVDLLRAGERMPLGEPAPTPADYFILIARSVAFPQAEVWPFLIRDRFPSLRIPLDQGDPDALVDLKTCLDRCYDGAQYSRSIHYDHPPDPPLRPVDAEWAEELLKKHAKRKKK